jgi:hypothetical protein
MITFTILLITLLSLAIAVALVVLAGSAGIILAFGDLFVCGLLIWSIVRLFKGKS